MAKVTLQTIADIVGVSVATVSMVLNNKPGISEKTRAMIWDTAVSTGYLTPKEVNAEIKMGAIALVVGNMQTGMLTENPFLSQMIESVRLAAQLNGYETAVLYQNDSGLFTGAYNGCIVLATSMQAEDIRSLLKNRIKTVVLDNASCFDMVDSVVPDNAGGVEKAFSYLMECGHTRIGYLKWTGRLFNFDSRFEAYQKCMEKFGFSLSSELVLSTPYGIESAAEAIEKQLSSVAQPATAYIADSDILALGAMMAFKNLHLQVGRDVSIVGFDDIPFAKLSSPPLSTVRVYYEEMGRAAVERLVQIMHTDSRPRLCTLSTTLRQRESVAKLK